MLLCWLQVEVEEEFLTNTLQKKLEKVGGLLGADVGHGISTLCCWWGNKGTEVLRMCITTRSS